MKPDPLMFREELLRNPTLKGATAYYAELGSYQITTIPLCHSLPSTKRGCNG